MTFNIDNFTIGEAKQLVACLVGLLNSASDHGLECPGGKIRIVILDKGFIFAGPTRFENGMVKISPCVNVRSWNGNQGLGGVALNPFKDVYLDNGPDVAAPLSVLKGLMETSSAWEKVFE